MLAEEGLTVPEERGMRMLCEAARSGNLAKVKMLRLVGVDLNVEDHDRRTALMHAAEHAHHQTLIYLLVEGAKPDRLVRAPTAPAAPPPGGRGHPPRG